MSDTTTTSDTSVTTVTTVTSEPAINSPLLVDAVLEGGGVRGIGHVGALVEAEKRGYQWVNVAGTSAGAFVASLLAAGYKATELYDILSEVDFSLFADTPGLDRFMAKKIFNIAIHGGIHPGHYMESFIREKLSARGIKTFGDLIVKGQEDDPTYRYKLTVIASDISTGRMVRLPQDAHSYYGLDPDDIDVARAVHMSASIPFFFIPVNQPYTNGSICRIVDGGLLSNFPIATFDLRLCRLKNGRFWPYFHASTRPRRKRSESSCGSTARLFGREALAPEMPTLRGKLRSFASSLSRSITAA